MGIAYVFFLTFVTSYHEWGHAVITRAFGGTAPVYFSFFGGYAVPSGVTGAELVVVAFSGGLLCALILWYIQWWWLDEPADWNSRLVCRFFMLNNLIYGIGEGLWMAGAVPSIYDFSLFASVASLLIVAGWYLYYPPKPPK